MTETQATGPQALTHSRMACNRACPRRHELRYELGLSPEVDGETQRIGTAFHRCKEAADLGLDVEAEMNKLGTLDPYQLALVCAMHQCHAEHYDGQTLSVVATELEFDLDVVNPDTGSKTPLWRLKGKIDRLYRLPDGRLAIMDYKTSGESLEPDSDLWMRLRLDTQMSIYVIAARELGHDVQTILYDVTRRPMLRPYKATPTENRKYTKAGALYANQREVDETPHEYVVRVAEAMRADPVHYFARHEIARLDSDLDQTRADIWTQQLVIREAQRSGRWFRNPGACVFPFKCSYLPICEAKLTKDSPVPAGFKKLDYVHPELTAPVTE